MDRGKVSPHFTKDDLAAMGNLGFKVFMGMKDEWGLSSSQGLTLLGLDETNRSTLNLWQARSKEGKAIGLFSRERLERLSHLAQIYRGVTSAFPEGRCGLDWLLASNTDPVFEGQSPLEKMLHGTMEDLAEVQAYLEGVLFS